MFNVNFNTAFCMPPLKQKKDVTKSNTNLLNTASMDTFCFTGRKRNSVSYGVISDVNYKNVLDKPLVSKPRSTFEYELSHQKLASYNDARIRISSLSRYLKEDMVGFVIPEYTVNNEKKGGHQWFEKGAEYMLRGAKEGKDNHGVDEKDYKETAKELYGLLALHDNYWKSPEFVSYLSSLPQTPAIKATIAAVKELRKSNVSFTGELMVSTLGYFSPLKFVDKLTETNCAYTGEKFRQKGKLENRPSLDHIMPKSWGGPCDDSNYILSTKDSNSRRGNIGLIEFLRGGYDETP